MRSLLNSFIAIKSWLWLQVAQQSGQSFLWLPVWLGLGIAVYFALPVEPAFYIGPCVFAVFGGIAFVLRRHDLRRLMLALCIVTLGFAAGQVRAFLTIGPSLAEEMRSVRVSGVIDQLDYLDSGGASLRFLLRDVTIEGVAPEEVPRRIRVSLRKVPDGVVYTVGTRVEGLAGLNPPSEPVVPGGFDFGRYMAFQKIGALGFFYRAPVVVTEPRTGLLSMERVRQEVFDRVMRALPGRQGAMAAALLTGKRTSIDEADLEAMRHSGLAHMLAISGLHVGLFSGVVFFVLRLGMVMIPGVGLTWPVKKIAAVLAFAAAVFYMGLAGATIPTQRAVLMIAIVFLAVLLDRTALSMRLVSFAAFVVLLFLPESLLSVSFQLSFAAVVALIWVYDALRGWFSAVSRHAGFWRKLGIYVGGVVLTTVVATIATAPFALYHFEQLAVLSVLANMLAMPVMTFVIMPFAVLSLVAMPVGLEAGPLWLMGQGADAVLWVAHFVAGQERAVLRVAAWPFGAFVAAVIGALVIVLVQGRMRWLGLAGFMLAWCLISAYHPPDILVAKSQDLWAYRKGGALYVSARNKEKFMRENWERYYGLPDGAAQRWDADTDMHCDRQACRIELKGRKISFLRDIEAMPIECTWADVLVSVRSVDLRQCAAPVVIDHQATKRSGTHAVWLDDAVRVDNVRAHLGDRPWGRYGDRF